MSKAPTPPDPTPGALADELDDYLERHVLAPRLPALFDDESWGFRAHFDHDWEPQPERGRFLVYQARVAWSVAFLVTRRPALRERLLPAARHGYAALRDHLADRRRGGFFNRVALGGEGAPEGRKFLYSNAFALLALTGLAAVEDPWIPRQEALALAESTGEWIERTLRRADGPGYLSAVALDGSRLPFDSARLLPERNGLEGPAAWPDLNSHLHLLEAYLELADAVPSATLDAALRDLVDLLLGRFYSDPGCLHRILDAQCRPVPGEVSFGHDLEGAVFLLAAAERLGRRDDPQLVEPARRLAEHALALGWDPHVAAWTGIGSPLARSRDLQVGYWVPFEALNTLACLAERWPEDEARYYRLSVDTWRFITQRLTDRRKGGTWQGFDDRGQLLRVKSGDWFSIYHATRALVVAADRWRDAARNAAEVSSSLTAS